MVCLDHSSLACNVNNLAARKKLPPELFRACGFRDLKDGGGIYISYGPNKRGRLRWNLVANQGTTAASKTWRSEWARDENGRKIPKRDAAGEIVRVGRLTRFPVFERTEVEIESGAFCPGIPDDDEDFVLAVEGETDVVALLHHGWWAIGIPGANAASCLRLDDLRGRQKVICCREPGVGGDAFAPGIARRLRSLGWGGSILEFKCKGFKDPCAMHEGTIHCPKYFDRWLQEALDAATPVPEPVIPPKRVRPPGEAPLGVDVSKIDLNQLRQIIADDVGADVGRTGRWKNSAGKFFCPFHLDGKKPNLSVFVGRDGKSRWKCQSCGEKGDCIDWLRRRQQVSFAEACKILGLDWKNIKKDAPPPKVCRTLSYKSGDEQDAKGSCNTYDKVRHSFGGCPNGQNIVLRHNDHGGVYCVEFPCHGKYCLHCRPLWNAEMIAHFKAKLDGFDGEPHLLITRDKWQTVRKRLERVRPVDYFGVLRSDGTTVLVSTSPIKDSSPVERPVAFAAIQEAIRAVGEGEGHPIKASRRWAPPPARQKSKKKFRRICCTPAKAEQIIAVCESRGIPTSTGSWEMLGGVAYTCLGFAREDKDGDVLRLIMDAEPKIKVRLTGRKKSA